MQRLWQAIRELTPAEVTAGSMWYDGAMVSLKHLSTRYEVGYQRVVYAAATLSPGLRWPATLELLELLLVALRDDQPMPRTGHATFGFRPREKAWLILKTGNTGLCRGLKVKAFAQALLGDRTAVVVDRHLLDLSGVNGTSSDRRRQPTPRQRVAIADAVSALSVAAGVSARDATAALWIKATA